MGKIDFSKFKTDEEMMGIPETSIISQEGVEIIPQHQMELASMNARQKGEMVAQATRGAVIVSMIDRAVNCIGVCAQVAGAVQIEKQKTEQVKAISKMRIIEAKEETKRIAIQQKEQTKQLMITCQAELAKQEIELKRLKLELKQQDKTMRDLHKRNMYMLKMIDKCIMNILDQNDLLMNSLVQRDQSTVDIEINFKSLQENNKQLAKLVEEMVGLRRGK